MRPRTSTRPSAPYARPPPRERQVVLLQELFETPYFCKDHLAEHFDLARPDRRQSRRRRASRRWRATCRRRAAAQRLRTAQQRVLQFARDDRCGRLGARRVPQVAHSRGTAATTRSTISRRATPASACGQTRYGTLGVGICWDQWFPEAARCMALMGAEVLLYPTAIGSEPHDATIDSRDHWQRCMQGHAAANVMPLVASNRIGVERGAEVRDDVLRLVVHRRSAPAAKVAEADRASEAVLTATFDLDAGARACVMRGASSATGGPTSTARSSR